MKPTLLLLSLCAVAAVANGALKLKTSYPGKGKGRLNGQISAEIQETVERKRRQAEDCSGASLVYRSEDGSCNNLDNPKWGASSAVFRRLLSPVYEYNGNVNGPVVQSLTAGGAALPNARRISAIVHTSTNKPDPRAAIMLMQWGQFLDHDLTGTPGDSSASACCSEDLVLSGAKQHSDVGNGGPCFPILIDNDDPHFTQTATRCMEFIRSLRTVPEGETEEQQMNILTAFVDASNVYGSSLEELNGLRGDNGELKEGHPGQLPPGDAGTCNLDSGNDDDYCLLAGDFRANVFPGLGAMHTVFFRQHNKLARALKARNPSWSSDKVFQEARKIVSAQMQQITYGEYLPKIVGNAAMAKYGLTEGTPYKYDATTDPTLNNVFATAAFRFGHSTIPPALNISGTPERLVTLFNKPSSVLNNLKGVVQGLLMDPTQVVDIFYTEDMTNRLFETAEEESFDIVALNIQRGRDHGLRRYNDWREYCGLPKIQNFEEMGSQGLEYQKVYDSPSDIDLYSGALHEDIVDGGSVGPTYACLIGTQFQSLKYGDRFWYETDSSEGFTAAQLAEIKKVTLSGVLCDAFDDDLSIQPDAFGLATLSGNGAVPCKDIPRMSVDAW